MVRVLFLFLTRFHVNVAPPPPPSPLPLTRPLSSSLREGSTWRFREQIARSNKTPALQAIQQVASFA